MDTEPKAFEWKFCPICGKQLVDRHDGEQGRPHCIDCFRFYYSNPAPAACAICMRDDKLLLVKRGVEPCLGEWCLPGGFIELGESSEEAVLRELWEETGIVGAEPRLVHVSTQPSKLPGSVMIVGYAIDQWAGEFRPGSDVLDVKLFAREERPYLPFKAHRDILAIFEKGTG